MASQVPLRVTVSHICFSPCFLSLRDLLSLIPTINQTRQCTMYCSVCSMCLTFFFVYLNLLFVVHCPLLCEFTCHSPFSFGFLSCYSSRFWPAQPVYNNTLGTTGPLARFSNVSLYVELLAERSEVQMQQLETETPAEMLICDRIAMHCFLKSEFT